ncbi:DNA repair protein RecN [Candidatus Fukatsuia symbiotica]|uniref:DNA repair protein RecN n=1 Tax=Candidatus Fukatsuia TaxID=1927833 RepID=UPI0009328797|nr:DNA repair protein RecN [Candidatus Fukatsuia symbiotica]MEA9444872.1 DNA repair protein RecN [Candidatus Fukatsuia symbiotica]
MLAQLTIHNFAIVRELEIDFQPGMTAITGETGAGKSIAIDALGLCLGSRSEGNMARLGTSRANICARFSLIDTLSARQWLKDHHLDDSDECLLRRVIGADGRSRGFINGTAVPLSQLRELGQLLIQIHGQNAHQLLLKSAHQKRLLDAYANQHVLLAKMQNAYQTWHQSRQALALYQQQILELNSRQQLLQYYLQELDALAPKVGKYEQIDAEYKRLANRGQLLSISQQVLQSLSDGEQQDILSQLHSVKQQIVELANIDDKLNNFPTMLEDALIQIDEVSIELRNYVAQLDNEPGRLHELEQQLALHLDLARKHHIAPEALPQFYQQLLAEQQLLAQQENDHQQLSQSVQTHYQHALEIADQLHRKRQYYAQELATLLTESMNQLAMPHGQFTIATFFEPESLSADGASRIEFCVTTNPGQPSQPLVKITSGGELSRIALAIQVITARKMDTPALIFDEVDVGISGRTAAIVGRLLRQLGESTQVMCVTHLPQVAGCGHQHFFVSKQTDGNEVETHMYRLDKKSRLQELARLLGGGEITKNTLANAKELLTA